MTLFFFCRQGTFTFAIITNKLYRVLDLNSSSKGGGRNQRMIPVKLTMTHPKLTSINYKLAL